MYAHFQTKINTTERNIVYDVVFFLILRRTSSGPSGDTVERKGRPDLSESARGCVLRGIMSGLAQFRFKAIRPDVPKTLGERGNRIGTVR